jgi:NAD+ synthase
MTALAHDVHRVTRSPLELNSAEEVDRIGESLREQVRGVLKRRGLVVGMSGGVDSSVCAGLAVRALGPKRVFALFMPERDSDSRSLTLAREWAQKLGIEYVTEDITPLLDGAGCYRRRDEAVRRVLPEFESDWKFKVVLRGNRLESDSLNVSFLAYQRPGEDEVSTVRLPAAEYLQIVAATNFKQRTRKMMEYYHADRLHYAVVGTPNRLEYDQGFFVKGGDGLADVKPIAHLYKTQVYQLAEFLGVPEGVTSRPPTTDTYSLPQSQEEFYFSLPATEMDLILHAFTRGLPASDAAEELGYRPEQVLRAYRDIEQKRATTQYLHERPLLVEPVSLDSHQSTSGRR